ncbi:hypothetical protein K2173_002166 [Erythroxylum novogranatense]|uniref:non-specific serine/threonine protein kinase n=1 Tax=Erythroxylum novogranatense TaxID=1862640 RepID=A0AAV8SPQ8_9ROSI|nr:hypothetical protein K2173_002166 [Erythroxylum novogranatense]
MGVCWSNQIKAYTNSNSGLNSKNVSRDGEDLSSSGSKLSSSSVLQTPRSEGEILQSSNLKTFTYSELKSATRNFRPDSVVGEGGFGSVFKGWIDEHTNKATKPGMGLVIAVKRLNQEGLQGHKEWLTEINYLGQLRHPHLVKLIGYCLEDEHRLLVYEFMTMGSVENHLFKSKFLVLFAGVVLLISWLHNSRTCLNLLNCNLIWDLALKLFVHFEIEGSHIHPLSWSTRMKIVLGAARGLAFLHSSEAKVIFRDFKTSNILLDSGYNAKLSDFGLARDGPIGDESHVSTRVMGTYGYAAPEYLATGRLTAKSDVYSFGVVLLEILSGRQAIDKNRPSGQHNLVEWAKPYLTNKRKVRRVLDTRLEGQYSLNWVQKVAEVARQCLALETKFRPTMDEVVLVLEQVQESKDVPIKVTEKKHKPNALEDTNSQQTAYPRPSASPLFA